MQQRHSTGAGQEAEKKQGKLIHMLVAIQDFTGNVNRNEYPKRVTIIHDLEVLAMRVRNSYLLGAGALAGRPEFSLHGP